MSIGPNTREVSFLIEPDTAVIRKGRLLANRANRDTAFIRKGSVLGNKSDTIVIRKGSVLPIGPNTTVTR